MWKSTGESWVFKTKSDPKKQRIVKTNLGLVNSLPLESIKQSYIREYYFGKWVAHMGYNYPIVNYQDKSFVIMRMQIGEPLDSLILKPYRLTITDRLRITVNLLTEVAPQIHEVQIPDALNPDDLPDNMTHCDIKPENIIIEDDLGVKYIDYGLAKSSSSRSKAGTPLYMDPLLFDGYKISADQISDLYSLARTIAKFWKDSSSDGLTKASALSERNANNTLTGLLENITGLTVQEKRILFSTIQKMTAYEEIDRLPREEALAVFQQLLDARIKLDHDTVIKNAQLPVEKLNRTELLNILHSTEGTTFLQGFKNDRNKFIQVINKLEHRILELDESALTYIATHLYDFKNPEILPFILSKEGATAVHLQQLIKLGAPVHPRDLEQWLLRFNEEQDELRWTTICRELYNAIPNAQNIISIIKNQDSFPWVYWHHFLSKNESSKNDKTNVRLVKRHLDIMRKNQPIISHIEELLKPWSDTPLAQAISSSDVINTASQVLLITVQFQTSIIFTKN